MSKQRLLVVGNGMVGHHFVEQLVNAGGLEQFEVTVLGAEPDSAYDRVHLSEVFGGRAPKELQMADPENRYEAFSEFFTDISAPNRALEADLQHRPILEKNPVLFWKLTALALLLGNLLQMFYRIFNAS